jgi:hypothetical protein
MTTQAVYHLSPQRQPHQTRPGNPAQPHTERPAKTNIALSTKQPFSRSPYSAANSAKRVNSYMAGWPRRPKMSAAAGTNVRALRPTRALYTWILSVLKSSKGHGTVPQPYPLLESPSHPFASLDLMQPLSESGESSSVAILGYISYFQQPSSMTGGQQRG